MLKRFRNNSGQSIGAELVITFVVVALAISMMSVYVRRAMQGRVRDFVVYTRDEASNALANSDGYLYAVALQYEPYYINSVATVGQEASDTSTIAANGEYTKTFSQTRSADSTSQQLAPKDWN
jgi:hypothetical protein